MEDLIHTYPAGAVLALLFVLILVWAITMYVWDDKLKWERRSHQVERLRHGRIVSELREQVVCNELASEIWLDKVRYLRKEMAEESFKMQVVAGTLIKTQKSLATETERRSELEAKYAPFMGHGKNQVRVNGRFGPKKEDANETR